jgi:hypothetical protein
VFDTILPAHTTMLPYATLTEFDFAVRSCEANPIRLTADMLNPWQVCWLQFMSTSFTLFEDIRVRFEYLALHLHLMNQKLFDKPAMQLNQ